MKAAPTSKHRFTEAKPLRIAHLVNCFLPKSGSEFEYVQPITLASMLRAKAECPPEIQVKLLSAHFPDAANCIPDGFEATPFLERTVATVLNDASLPPFPLIGDLLENLYKKLKI